MPLDEIDVEILDFVGRYIDQFAAWEILAYFHENPDVERKPSGIATDLGRKIAMVEPSLDMFVMKGILIREVDEVDEPTYRYSAQAGFRENMDAFVAATRDRTTRLAIVSLVLQKETRRLYGPRRQTTLTASGTAVSISFTRPAPDDPDTAPRQMRRLTPRLSFSRIYVKRE